MGIILAVSVCPEGARGGERRNFRPHVLRWGHVSVSRGQGSEWFFSFCELGSAGLPDPGLGSWGESFPGGRT